MSATAAATTIWPASRPAIEAALSEPGRLFGGVAQQAPHQPFAATHEALEQRDRTDGLARHPERNTASADQLDHPRQIAIEGLEIEQRCRQTPAAK